MIQLILHGIGDYFIQTDKWALNKKKEGWFGFRCCFIHCLTYALPFLLIANWLQVSLIFLTHFFIDRYHIIDYVLAWKNGVKKEVVDISFGEAKTKKVLDISNFGFGLDRPFAISIWLYIITDNLVHIIGNYLILKYI